MTQMAYIQGVLDTESNIEFLSTATARQKGMDTNAYYTEHPDVGMFASIGCTSVTDMSPVQKIAVLNKYMADNPKLWWTYGIDCWCVLRDVPVTEDGK